MAQSAKTLYLEYYQKILPKLDMYPKTFQTQLGLLMERIETLEFQEHANWEKEFQVSIRKSVPVLIQDFKSDIIDWQPALGGPISLSRKGDAATPSNVITSCHRSIRALVTDYERDPKGLEPTPREDLYAFLCYELSEQASQAMEQYMAFPGSMRNMHPRWDCKIGTDIPRFCLAATHTGNVTRVHHDDVSVDSCILHIAGRKLWALWDNSKENTAAVRSRTISYEEITLEWLLENLTPPKLYFTADLGPRHFHSIFLPHHSWHLVFTFSTSFAISGSYCSTTLFDEALWEIREEMEHIGEGTLMMKEPEQRYWCSLLRRNIANWGKYLEDDAVAEVIGVDGAQRLDALRQRFHNMYTSRFA